MSYLPSVVGTVLISTLSITNKTGLVVSYWISCAFSPYLQSVHRNPNRPTPSLVLSIVPFSIFLSWVGMSTSGHTKRITVNALVLIASSAGNLAGPFIWKTKYVPRNRIPFSIISACSVMSACTLFFIRQYLVYQNKVKDEQAAVQVDREDKYNEVYITVMEGGMRVEKRVDRVRLTFIFPLIHRSHLLLGGSIVLI
jgi:ACS family allantoate permease-like MFS transporter